MFHFSLRMFETFLDLIRTEGVMLEIQEEMHLHLQLKCSLFLSDFYQNYIASTKSSENLDGKCNENLS